MNKSPSTRDMSIGDLAGRFGLAASVLRHWETLGLLLPAGRVGGRRHYGEAQAARVAMILRSQEVGFSLEQIRALLNAQSGVDRRKRLVEQRGRLDRQAAAIANARAMIDHALECEAEDFTSCPHFLSLVQDIERRAFHETPDRSFRNFDRS